MELGHSDNSVLMKISMSAAWLSLVTGLAFLVVLTSLHFIKPEVDPSWQTISIYARGAHGWIMRLNYGLLAISYAALSVAIRSQITNAYSRIGLALLLIASIGAVFAGIGVSDPLETPQNALSQSGKIHAFGAAVALWFLPLASLLTSLSLIRKNSAWSPVQGPLLWTIGLPFLGLAVFVVAFAPSNGHYGPGVNIGWPNRLASLLYGVWQITLVWQAIKLGSQARPH